MKLKTKILFYSLSENDFGRPEGGSCMVNTATTDNAPKAFSGRLYLLLFFVCLIFLTGCYESKRYSYKDVKQQYFDDFDTSNKDFKTDVEQISLTLHDAVQVAFANNPDSKIAASRVKQAQAIIEQSKSVFWPKIGIYTRYSQGDAPSSYLFNTIDQRELPADVNFNKPGWYENYETGIQAQVNLFNGGKDIISKEIAALGFDISNLDSQSIRNNIMSMVIKTYYDYLAVKEYIKIAKESVNTVNAQLNVMQVRYDAGGALKSDLLSLKVRKAQAQEDVVKSENRLKITLAVFATILGLNPDITITFQEQKCKIDLNIPKEYNVAAVYALEHRPELEKLRKQIIQSKKAVDKVVADYLPSVNLQLKYYHDDPDFSYDSDRENWVAAVLFNWDLFTGFSTKYAQKQALHKLGETIGLDQKNLLAIKLEVKQAYLNQAEAQARLKVAKQSVLMAEETLNLVKQQYAGGSATITRYLEAELARNLAKIRETSAFYDKEKARIEIARVIFTLINACKL